MKGFKAEFKAGRIPENKFKNVSPISIRILSIFSIDKVVTALLVTDMYNKDYYTKH